MSLFIFIAVSTVLGVSGQLMLKHGMNRMGRHNPLLYMALSPWVIGGLLIYGFGVIAWLAAMSHLELSYIYPFASLSYIGIIFGSWFLFKEKISALRVVGIVVIIVGVLITSQS